MVVVVAVRGDRVWVVLDRHRDLEASLGEAKRQPTRAGEEIGDAQVSDACAQLSPIGSLYSPPDFSTRGREDSGPSPCRRRQRPPLTLYPGWPEANYSIGQREMLAV